MINCHIFEKNNKKQQQIIGSKVANISISKLLYGTFVNITEDHFIRNRLIEFSFYAVFPFT